MANARRPRKPKPIRGEFEETDPPVWEPLLSHVGGYLASWFMYMEAVRLTDGTRVHMYKHQWTRRYFHLADDGRCFGYDGDSAYVPLRTGATILQVFDGWHDFKLDEEEHEAHDHALRAALYWAWRRDDDVTDMPRAC